MHVLCRSFDLQFRKKFKPLTRLLDILVAVFSLRSQVASPRSYKTITILVITVITEKKNNVKTIRGYFFFRVYIIYILYYILFVCRQIFYLVFFFITRVTQSPPSSPTYEQWSTKEIKEIREKVCVRVWRRIPLAYIHTCIILFQCTLHVKILCTQIQ